MRIFLNLKSNTGNGWIESDDKNRISSPIGWWWVIWLNEKNVYTNVPMGTFPYKVAHILYSQFKCIVYFDHITYCEDMAYTDVLGHVLGQNKEIYPGQITQFHNNTENTNMASRLPFEYVIILHSEPQRDAQGNDVTPDSKVVGKSSEAIIAADTDHVKRIAARNIPKEIKDSDLARIEIKVKGF